MVLTVAAVWLIGSRDVAGQWAMLAAQVCWLCVAAAKDMRPLAMQSVILGGLTIRSIVEWGTK